MEGVASMTRNYWSDPGHAPLPWKPLIGAWLGIFVVVIAGLEARDRARGNR
jgi:hypothetical protein